MSRSLISLLARGNLGAWRVISARWGTSPHLRGNLGGGDRGAHRLGDIPAPTGEPIATVDLYLGIGGHPRTYGGTVLCGRLVA